MRRAAVVYNPTKIADFPRLQRRIDAFMSSNGWDAPMWMETTQDDPGIGMCERAVHEECDVVFVCGGDGTVMAAVTALAGCGVPMALLPTGTGNLLARNLGLPLDDEEGALRIGIDGETRRIDVGVVEDRKFAVMAGMGFDAAIMRDAPEGVKKVVGWRAYFVSGTRHLRDRGIGVTVTVDDGEPMRRHVRTALVGNVGRLQGGIPLLTDAEPDDGLLDVALVAPKHLVDWLRIVGRVVRRSASPDRRLERFRGRRVLVEADTAQPRQLDGDLIAEGKRLDIHIEPAALAVRVRR